MCSLFSDTAREEQGRMERVLDLELEDHRSSRSYSATKQPSDLFTSLNLGEADFPHLLLGTTPPASPTYGLARIK